MMDFIEWYNKWMLHSKLEGSTPNEVFYGCPWKKPAKDSKKIPTNIETRYFPETRITTYKLKKDA